MLIRAVVRELARAPLSRIFGLHSLPVTRLVSIASIQKGPVLNVYQSLNLLKLITYSSLRRTKVSMTQLLSQVCST